MTCSIKICGITSVEDALMASEAGADYLGVLVNVKQSPRSVSVEAASMIIAAAQIPVIVLTYDHSPDEVLMIADALHPSGVQLAGNESHASIASLRDNIKGELWKSLHLPLENTDHPEPRSIADQIKNLAQIGINKIILDTTLKRGNIILRGGTGKKCDWSLAAKIKEEVTDFLFLAGGINPANVKEALLLVRPDGIDVSSGVERAPGKKDPSLLKRLIEEVKNLQSSDIGDYGQ